MALGDTPDDQRLHDAWEGFCDRLKVAGSRAFKETSPANPMQRADAFRFLTQNLGQAFDIALETKDTQYPMLHAFSSPTCKLASDCADYVYIMAWIDGNSVYRISGNRGTARFINFAVQGPRPEKMANGAPSIHEPFGDTPETNISGQQLKTDWDGGFELYIGGEKQGENWVPTTPVSRKLFIRQGFDRFDERPATFRIERIGMTEPKPLPTPARMVEAIDWAGMFLDTMMETWPDWGLNYGGMNSVNAFPGGLADTEADKKRGRAASSMHWVLAPDEALIVEFDRHDGLWMFTNMGAFCTSMDFLYRPVSYTPSRSKVDADGKIRLVLAHDDPGLHNWVDTQGFERGHLTYRHMLEGAPVPLATRLVKREALDKELPADTARVTPAERTAMMMERYNGILQRYKL
jgi:hypothetical protein